MLKASGAKGCQLSNHRAGLPSIERLRERYAAHGQEHVFRFWDRLDPAARERLLRQAAGIDLPALLRGFAASRSIRSRSARLEPAPVEVLPERGGDAARWAKARNAGEGLLAEGRVGLLVVAGGQASRLGFGGPKGAFPIGPVSERSLFAQQAQKIRRLRGRCGRPLPWYVMTSEANDAETRRLFADADHFGLPPDDVFFLRQAMLPSLDFEGKLMLTAADRIFENPDGHGGSLIALRESGALDDMERRGIDTLFYYQVDNPLTLICSASFLGFHVESGAQMSCKALRKRDPGENVGVLARIDGRVGVVEYTEIDDYHRSARDAAGGLVHWAGNMAVHVFDVEFARHLAAQAETLLPYHASAKKIPTLDAKARPVQPAAPNGYKLERFVFDALAATDRVCIVEARREREYAPVKNARGADSPETARRALSALYRSWLEAAEIELPEPQARIEIDQSVVDGVEDARNLGIRRIDQASDVIRTAAGDQA